MSDEEWLEKTRRYRLVRWACERFYDAGGVRVCAQYMDEFDHPAALRGVDRLLRPDMTGWLPADRRQPTQPLSGVSPDRCRGDAARALGLRHKHTYVCVRVETAARMAEPEAENEARGLADWTDANDARLVVFTFDTDLASVAEWYAELGRPDARILDTPTHRAPDSFVSLDLDAIDLEALDPEWLSGDVARALSVVAVDQVGDQLVLAAASPELLAGEHVVHRQTEASIVGHTHDIIINPHLSRAVGDAPVSIIRADPEAVARAIAHLYPTTPSP